jgi:hypothetical protein
MIFFRKKASRKNLWCWQKVSLLPCSGQPVMRMMCIYRQVERPPKAAAAPGVKNTWLPKAKPDLCHPLAMAFFIPLTCYSTPDTI